jgi:ATP-dependent helicase HrpA
MATSPSSRPLLPVLARRGEIEQAIRSHQVVVLAGETGSGKTTQLPQICLEMGLADTGMVGHTQPRRLAARAVAARIAEERSTRLGDIVGVKVRFQDQTSRSTKIKLLTDGMLLAELNGDPMLRAYSVIIVDEAHERSLNIDFLLGCLRQLLPKRPDLKVIITSATIDPQKFVAYFKGAGVSVAPMLEISGRMFPVEIRYRAPRDDDGQSTEVNIESVADGIEDVLDVRASSSDGDRSDVLVFLPGEREIRRVGETLARRRVQAEVLPLFGRLSSEEQDRIFHPPAPGSSNRQRVILATNVAETSLTVPGIRYVVDAGLARLNRYNASRKIQGLPIEPISQASANQRAGRCGRVASGICIRLYSESSFRARPAFTEPEIRRSSLANVILQMTALNLGTIEAFPFLDPPDHNAIRDGYETLFELGAITKADASGKLTPIGQAMSRMPLDVRIARMLIGAEREGSLREVVILAGVLSIQDPRERPLAKQEEADRNQSIFRHPSSDFLTLLNLWRQYQDAKDALGSGIFSWCREHFLSPARMREWDELVRQLQEQCDELKLEPNDHEAHEDSIHRALLTGLISNVACRESGDKGGSSFDYRAIRGNVVQIFPGSSLFKKNPRWIMAAELVQTSRLFARTVARIDPEWIEQLAGHVFTHQFTDPHLDAETGEPSAWERVSLSGVVVVPRRRIALKAHDPAQARAVFIEQALATGKWTGDHPSLTHNRNVLEHARTLEARLRQRNTLADPASLVAWYGQCLPQEVCDPATFDAWVKQADPSAESALRWTIRDVVAPEALIALDSAAFPDAITIGDDTCPITYALAPGKDDDGVTLSLSLHALAQFPIERAEWLVPGMLTDVVAGLLKQLPKTERARLEAKASLEAAARECASVMSFASGSVGAALSEALEVLYSLAVPATLWSTKGLPAHLRLRIRVIDEHGKVMGEDRDTSALLKKFEHRIKKLRAAGDRAAFERANLTDWTFGDLPMTVSIDRDGATVERFPALVDDGTTARLTLVDRENEASSLTWRGVRRLLALACRDELAYIFEAHAGWHAMTKQYSPFGSTEELRDDLTLITVERAFMEGQAPIRTQNVFHERLQSQRGRLSLIARETTDGVARTLEARAKVAHRLASGTPRLWAESIADIREHATYLMPRHFLRLAPAHVVRNYPRYAEGMRERLFALREDGSKAETVALQKFLPHWKKFTGWVASAMSEARSSADSAEPAPRAVGAAGGKQKSPLPQTRRVGASVNLDAGAWAIQPGNLTPEIEAYRWSLEDLRLALFAPALAGKSPMTEEQVSKLWAKVKA